MLAEMDSGSHNLVDRALVLGAWWPTALALGDRLLHDRGEIVIRINVVFTSCRRSDNSCIICMIWAHSGDPESDLLIIDRDNHSLLVGVESDHLMRARPSIVLAPDFDVAGDRELQHVSHVRAIASCKSLIDLALCFDFAHFCHCLMDRCAACGYGWRWW